MNCRHVRDEYYRYICEVVLGLLCPHLTVTTAIVRITDPETIYIYVYESDQHATGSCRPDVILVPFCLFLGWALRSSHHLHPKDLNWGSNCCNTDTERQ